MKTLILLEKLAISLGKAEETSHPFCLEMPKGLGSQLHTSWTASLLPQTEWAPRPTEPLAPPDASEAVRLAAFLPFSAILCLFLSVALPDHQPSMVPHGLVLPTVWLYSKACRFSGDSVLSSSESSQNSNFKSQWKLRNYSSISFPHEGKPQVLHGSVPLAEM